MIISRTPLRISFFGGGTDFPDWYNQSRGKVISTSIDKYSYITVRYLPPFFEFSYRLRYYIKEEVKKISSIKHSSIRETLKYLKFKEKLEIIHNADLPAQSGLGASSSFTVGLLNGFVRLGMGVLKTSAHGMKTSAHGTKTSATGIFKNTKNSLLVGKKSLQVTTVQTRGPLEMSGAIGSEQLKKWPTIMDVRQENANHFISLFKDKSWCRIQKTIGLSSWFTFGIVLDGALKGRRTEIVKALDEAGIQNRPLASRNFLKQPVMRDLDHIASGEMTAADDIHDNGFFVGNGSKDIRDELDLLYKTISKFVI